MCKSMMQTIMYKPQLIGHNATTQEQYIVLDNSAVA